MKVKRALLSVSEKAGIVDFAHGLKDLGVDILATGGTARLLNDAGIECLLVENVTGFPEIMSGRVKTLHPAIVAGILARRRVDLEELSSHDIRTIDLVAVNLYPFEEVAFKGDKPIMEVLEQIDIGGCTLLRSAAKNYPDVVVVASPSRYDEILERLKGKKGGFDEGFRLQLAREAFHHTAIYDALIGRYFDEQAGEAPGLDTLSHFNMIFRHALPLRYGENPHQSASFFRDLFPDPLSIASAVQHHGKELSYNNILDLDSAVALAVELPERACVIVKHTNPCGVGLGKTPVEAYRKALETDPVSAFGSIIALNVGVDEEVASEMNPLFVECLVAPSYDREALLALKEKKNLRILELPGLAPGGAGEKGYHIRSVRGGLLVQEPDRTVKESGSFRVVTRRGPTPEETKALRLAWVVCKHVKSNGIALSVADRTIGIGTGQMSRVDSVEIAMMKARNAGLPTERAVMASDAFFPFRDGLDRAAEGGITAVIQPGGSIRDEEVIRAADERGMAMLFTGSRHFRH